MFHLDDKKRGCLCARSGENRMEGKGDPSVACFHRGRWSVTFPVNNSKVDVRF